MADRIDRRAQAGGHVLEGLIDEQNRGAGILQRVCVLLLAPAGVTQVQHAIGPGHREAVLEVAVRVEGKHGDPVTTLQSQSAQGAGEARHSLDELAVAACALAVDGHRPVGGVLGVTV
ncbi:hypothetical protein D3C85_1109470 [compost metagenome]